jgi:hypothetical protein
VHVRPESFPEVVDANHAVGRISGKGFECRGDILRLIVDPGGAQCSSHPETHLTSIHVNSQVPGSHIITIIYHYHHHHQSINPSINQSIHQSIKSIQFN